MGGREGTSDHVTLSSGLALPIPGRGQGFRHVRGPRGKLIVPSDSKQSWQMEERPFRSLLVSEDGRVLSSGFPRFANLGERGFADHGEDLRSALAHDGEIWVTEKVDGSLVIRSVVGGEVLWRTRGSWGMGPFEEPVLGVAARHPALADPSFEPGRSLLFEFTSSSPSLRVVLAHKEDSLTLLGAVSHADLGLAWRDELEGIAAACGVPLVQTVSLTGSLRDWKREVGSWAGREGVVIRLPRGQMMKLKAKSYLELHRLKTHFSLRATKRMILAHDLRTREGFEEYLAKQGADWEIVRSLEALIMASMEARGRAAARFPALQDEVDALFLAHPGRRSEQLAHINALPEAERQAALLIHDGRPDAAEAAFERALLEEALEPFDDPRQDSLLDE
jgi:hypothetical protein